MKDAYARVAKFHEVESIDYEIVRFVENVISEIDGFPKSYAEVREMAAQRASQEDFRAYMNAEDRVLNYGMWRILKRYIRGFWGGSR